MACNTIPQAYPSLVVHLTEAEGGATGIGPSLPYVTYISAINEGAESDLSDPVTATPVLAQAA